MRDNLIIYSIKERNSIYMKIEYYCKKDNYYKKNNYYKKDNCCNDKCNNGENDDCCKYKMIAMQQKQEADKLKCIAEKVQNDAICYEQEALELEKQAKELWNKSNMLWENYDDINNDVIELLKHANENLEKYICCKEKHHHGCCGHYPDDNGCSCKRK